MYVFVHVRVSMKEERSIHIQYFLISPPPSISSSHIHSLSLHSSQHWPGTVASKVLGHASEAHVCFCTFLAGHGRPAPHTTIVCGLGYGAGKDNFVQ